jgi:hypothetical protein
MVLNTHAKNEIELCYQGVLHVTASAYIFRSFCHTGSDVVDNDTSIQANASAGQCWAGVDLELARELYHHR